ncbi:MAG: HAMP domain-containing protein [Armatimonadetes bacterium]|nr:HAMP domain-containing protein [Armatimonadota bacterium]
MRRSIRWKLTSSYLILVTVALVVVTAYVVRALQQSYVNTYSYVVATQAKVISLMMREYVAGRDLTSLQPMVQELRWRKEATITLVDATHRAASPTFDPSYPEVQKAFAGEESQAVRADPLTGERRVYAAAPIFGPDKTIVGIVHVSAPEAWVWRQLRRIAPALGTAMLLGLAAAWFVGARLSRRITRPLEEFSRVADRISSGDLAGRAPVDDTDELGRLGRSFNAMADRLQRTIQEISAERNKIEAIVAGMTDAVVATDRDGRIMLLNRAAEELLRLERGHVAGRSAREVIGDGRLVAMLDDATERARLTAEELPPGSVGDRVVEAHCAPITGDGGAVVGAVAVLRDVTELRETERLRRELTANVSHELRTPLTSIVGFIETLLDGAMNDEVTARHFLTIVDDEANRLVKLVDDLMDLSRLESKRVALELKPVDVGFLVHHVVDKMRPLAEASQLVLSQSVPSGLIVPADADRLEQVLTNLVDNALKYTPPGGRVEVRAAAMNGEIAVEVSDTGRGIPPEDLPHVFERFYRADRSRTRGSGGTGLGLAIAKHIVEAHGGRISVRSRSDEGTAFVVTLPTNGGLSA